MIRNALRDEQTTYIARLQSSFVEFLLEYLWIAFYEMVFARPFF